MYGICIMAPRALIVASLAIGCSLAGGAAALAGLKDTQTGGGCVGLECVDADKRPAGTSDLPPRNPPSSNSSADPLPWNVTTDDCSVADDARIRFAVQWLQGNVPAITAKMLESPDLMFWPGNSRENFEEKLFKDLKVVCISQKNKCEDKRGISYPIFAQERINLCSAQINQATIGIASEKDALFIGVIAHEIGHLVRLNGHSNCWDRYTNGSFSDAVGFAAEYAFRGVRYDPAIYTDSCSPEPFDWQRKVENMEKPLQSEK